MTPEERLERLEHRVATLETLLRRLTAGGAAASVPQAGPPAGPPAAAPPPRRPVSPPVGHRPVADRSVADRSVEDRPVADRPVPRLTIDPEKWIGERGLLAVGVVALILAAGYLLKLSFDRGWVSPLMRCVGGAVAGIIVGALGWRLESRYRTYGAALVGCGAAIIYLAVWAAVRQYQFLPATPGIIALATVSLVLALIAFTLDVEALGATAAVGAFFAPIFLSPGRGNDNVLLLYLAVMAGTLGLVAARRAWRLAALVIGASYFGLGWVIGAAAAGAATPSLLLAYGVAGGTAGLLLGLGRRWWEVRALSFWGGWALMASATGTRAGPGLLAGAIIMAAPLWWHGFRSPRIWPLRTAPYYRGAEWSLGEAVYFFVTPLFLAWAVRLQAPERFDALPGLAAALVGVAYALAGYVRPRPAFALAGAAALAVASWLHWPALGAVWALLALAAVWATLDHLLDRSDGRWYALATLAAALTHLGGQDALMRLPGDPAFTGGWALAVWAAALLSAGLAAGLWRPVGMERDVRSVRAALWVVAGALLLFGVTAEIRRYFRLHSAAAELAGSLAVSAWWLVFATGLVLLGFGRDVRPVRQFGLGVAALAGAKVLLVDLSALDALYRVGSVFILGLASLLVAYLYHRHARGRAPAE
jgi:uncharacterized membrane protein